MLKRLLAYWRETIRSAFHDWPDDGDVSGWGTGH
jgi:hypothetical protein